MDGFKRWAAQASVGSTREVRVKLASRTDGTVQFEVYDPALDATPQPAPVGHFNLELESDAIPQDVVHAFEHFEDSKGQREIVEKDVWDELVAAEFTRGMRGMSIELSKNVQQLDGTYRVYIFVMRHNRSNRTFQFVKQRSTGKTWIKKIHLH